jgi:hypothetical protein
VEFDVTARYDHDKCKVMFRLNKVHLVGGYEMGRGYETDFASVPKFVRYIINQVGKHNRAALIHDWEYDHKIGTRKQADDRFYREMRIDHVNWFKAQAMYWAVRCFGKTWWDRTENPRIILLFLV